MTKTEKEKNILRHGALIAALPLSLATVLLYNSERMRASAGAVSVFEGTMASSISALEETPVELKSVRFSIGVSACGAGDYCEDASTITAAYTLYNPTETQQKVSLAFPYELIETCAQTSDWNKPENCRIHSDGEEIPFQIRHTYKKMSKFPAAVDYSQPIVTGKDFFSPSLPVVKYTYKISLSQAYENYSTVKLFLNGDARTGIVRETADGADIKNGYRYLRYETKEKEFDVTYYALGGTCEVCFTDCADESEQPQIALVEKAETTFSEFCEQARPDWIDAEDWYAAAVDFFEDAELYGTYPSLKYCAEQSFVRWYLYEVTVPAQGTNEHTVSVPFYPATSRNANRYCVRLSSLATFPRFGEFAVEVQTPLTMVYSNMDFTREGDCYVMQREGCPYGDLEFFLSAAEDNTPFVPNNEGNPLIVALIILSVVVLGAAAVTVVLVVKGKRARKHSELLRQQADRCRPEEGKIDDAFRDDID